MANTSYRWVIVAAGGLLGCVAIGAMFSLPVFLLPISQDTGWSHTGISGAMTIGFLATALASMGWRTLSDHAGEAEEDGRETTDTSPRRTGPDSQTEVAGAGLTSDTLTPP